MIHITKIKNGCNCYLVEQGDAAILIDAGASGNVKQVVKTCEGKNVRLLFITHGHVDHIQGAAEVAKKLNIPIAMSEKDIELMDNNLSQPMYAYGFFSRIVQFFSILSAKNSKINKFSVEVLLHQDISLKEYGIDAKVIELPGHTKGSVGLKIEDHLFVGDALMNMTKPCLSYLYENMNDLLHSAEEITKEGNVTIHFGHGKAVSNRNWV